MNLSSLKFFVVSTMLIGASALMAQNPQQPVPLESGCRVICNGMESKRCEGSGRRIRFAATRLRRHYVLKQTNTNEHRQEG